MTLTEGDLAPVDTYPDINATGNFTLTHTTDNLVGSTLSIDSSAMASLQTELEGLTSGQTALDITINTVDGVITITGNLTGTTDEVFSITLTPTEDGNGNVSVAIEVTQSRPLDHQDSTGSYVNVDGDSLSIQLPVQIEDADGDSLTEAANVTVIINDGDAPVISAGELADITETATGGNASGSVTLDVGSDAIDRFEWNADQPTLDDLKSNGQDTEYSVNGNEITLYLTGDSSNPILTIIMNNDGTFTVNQTAPLEQANNPDDTIHLALDVTAFDKDGDSSNSAQAKVDIIDGADPTGTGTSVVITEGDLSPTTGYPVIDTTGSFTLNQVTDKLIGSTFTIDETAINTLQTELEGLTSGGTELDIVISVNSDTGVVTISGSLVGSGDNVFSIILTPTENANGNVDVAISLTQNQPLDHLDMTGSYVNVTDDVLNITLPVQIQDADGDLLVDSNGNPAPVEVVVTINDGDDPEFTAVPIGPTVITESQEGNTVTPGDLVLDTGSDNIDALTFNLSDAQLAALNALTSNGQDTSLDLSEDGVITVYIPAQFGGADIPVLVITLNNTSKDGSYTIEQLNPIDQPDSESINLDFNVVATDMDGDSDDVMISITISDGEDATSVGVVANFSVSEGNLDDNGSSNDYPIPTTNDPENNTFTVKAVNDYLDPSSLIILEADYDKLATDIGLLTSDGRSISIADTLVVGDDGVITITATADDGSVVFTLTLTPEYELDDKGLRTGNVIVSMDIEQYAPLDHLAGNQINITIPVQLQDTDGDYLVGSDGETEAPINIGVAFDDGINPSLGTDTGIAFTEVNSDQDDVAHSGKISISIGSDTISSLQFALTSDQIAALDALTSSGQTTEVEYTDGQIIVYLSDGTAGYNAGTDTPVLIITLDNVAKDGSYTVEQFESLDQATDTNETNLTFDVTATDHDNDVSAPGTIHVVITDGNDPVLEPSSGITLNESDAVAAGVSGVSDTRQIVINTGSDGVKTIVFQSNQPTFDGLTSNGEPTTYEVEPYLVTLFDNNGNTLLTVTLDDSGNYTVTVFGPIDQEDSQSTDIELNVTATDFDNDTTDGTLTFAVTDGDSATGDGLSGSISIVEGTLSSSDPDAGYPDPAPTGSTGNIFIAAGVERLDPTTVQIKPSDLNTLMSELEADLTSGGQALVFEYDSANGTLIGRVGSDTGAIALTIVLTATQNGQGVDINVSMTQSLPLDHDQDSSGANSSGWVTVNDSEIHINLPVQVQDTDGDYLDNAVDIDLTIVDGTNPTFTVDSGVTVDESAINAGGDNHQGSNPSSNTETATGQISITLGSDEIANFKIDIEAFNTDGSLTSQGAVVELVDNNDGTFSGIAGGREVFVVTFSPDGAYTFTITGALDHNKATGNDTSLTIPLPIYAVDKDGDVVPNDDDYGSSTINIIVNDDVPTVQGNTFDVNEGETITALLLPSSEGADDIASISLSFADTENGAITEHSSPFGLTDVYKGDQLLGQISVDSEGIVTFVSNPDLADVQESITLDMDIIITDKDGDQDSGTVTLDIHDQDPAFIFPNPTHGQEEDGQELITDGAEAGLDEFDNVDGTNHLIDGIEVSMGIDLGDVDRGEAIVDGSFTITLPADAHGQFYYNGAFLTPNAEGKVTIPSGAISAPDGDGVVTISGVKFIPDEDYSTDGITFVVDVQVSTTDGELPQSITGELTISVDGIADIPVWSTDNVTEYKGSEDTAIKVDGLSAQLNDDDNSETLYYLVQIADGSEGTLAGTGLVETETPGIFRIAASDIDSLTVTPPEDFSGDIHINAWAQSEEQGPYVEGKQTADSEVVDVVVRVEPVADEATLKVTRIESDEDTAIDLKPLITLNHTADTSDGSETLYVRFSYLPDGSQLLLNGTPVELIDGSYDIPYSDLDQLQFLPAPESSGDFTLTVEGIVRDTAEFQGDSVLDPEAAISDEYITGSKNINISVKGVADEPRFDLTDSDWKPIDDEYSGIEITIPEDGSTSFDFGIVSGETARVNPDDGSETLSVVISGIPEGTIITSNGSPLDVTFVGMDGNGQPIYEISLDSLDDIKITPPPNSTVDLELTAKIVVTEADGDSAEYEKDIIIHVEPVIDAGDFSSTIAGVEDTPITIDRTNWMPPLADSQEKVTHLTFTLPIGADPTGYTLIIVQGGVETELNFDAEGKLNLDQYLEALADGSAVLQITTPENSDKDFTLGAEVTIRQDDVDSDAFSEETVTGSITIDIQAAVEQGGDPYNPDPNADNGVGKIVISTGADANNDGIIDDAGIVTCDTTGVVDLSNNPGSGVGTIMYAENDLSSNEIIMELVLDFSHINLPEGQGFVVVGAVNNGDGSWTVKSGSLDNIQIQAPANFTDTVTVHVTAKVQDQGDRDNDGNLENDKSEIVVREGDIELDFSNNQNTNTELAADIIVEDTIVLGVEDKGVNLGSQLTTNGSISVSTNDVNGDGNSEIPNDVMTVVIDSSQLPSGATITGAEYDFQTGQYVYQATLNPDGTVNLSSLGLVLPNDYAGDFQFEVKYVTTDANSGDVNEATQNVVVKVDPVVDAGPGISLNVVSSSGLNQDYQPISESDDKTEVVYDNIAYEDATITLDFSAVSFGDTLNTVEGGLETLDSLTIRVDPSMGHFLDSEGKEVSVLTLSPDELSNVQFIPTEDFSGQVDISVSGTITDTATYDILSGTATDTKTTAETTVSFDVVAVNDDVKVEIIDGGIQGDEDTAISLGGGTVTLQDIDGSESMVSLLLTNIPEGFTVLGAVNNGGGEWSVSIPFGSTSFDLNGISLIPPKNFSGNITIDVVLYTKEDSLDSVVSFTHSIDVEVLPVADQIDADVVTSAQGLENGDILLDLDISTVDNKLSDTTNASNVTENGPEIIQITISNVPVGMGASFSFPNGEAGTIIDNGDGTWTITTESGTLDSLIFNPGDANNMNWDGELQLDIRSVDNGVVADASLGVQTTINVDVTAVNDAPENTLPTGELAGMEGEVTIINGLSISDVDVNDTVDGQMKVVLSSSDGLLSIPDDYSGSVTIIGNDSGELTLTGSLDAINDLLSGGVEYIPNSGTGGSDATITMTTSDNGNSGTGGVLSDSDTVTVSVAAPVALMSAFAMAPRAVPHTSVTAAQLALIPLLALLGEKVNSAELVQVELKHLGLSNIVDSAGQPLGETQEDGSWVIAAQDLDNAFINDLPEGEHSLEVAIVEQHDDETITSQSMIEVTVQPNDQNVLETADASDTSHSSILVGGDEPSLIIGTDGDDVLIGGLGMDILTGGAGNDELWGGEYNGTGDGVTDIFVWHAEDVGASGSPAIDVIKDFELNIDKIDLRDLFSDGDSEGVQMDDMLAGITASVDEGKVNLNVTSESGGEQIIVLDNVSTDSLGLDSTASSSDIISSLYNQHNAFTVDN